MSLKGGAELRARLKALRSVFKPAGRVWGDKTVELAKPRVPYRTGTLRGSIRVRNNTQRRTTVVGHYAAFFIDKGTKAHEIAPKRARSLVFATPAGRTIFTKKVNHPRVAAKPFRAEAAREGLRRAPMAQEVIRLWNAAR